MRARIGRLGLVGVAAIVQLAVLVLAHDLVYLARYGSRYGEALIHSGHGGAWQAAVTSSIVLGSLAAVVAFARLARLHFLVRRERAAGAAGRLERATLLRTWLRIGPALAISTVVLLTIQENLEQSLLFGHSAGIGILLSPEYAGGLWIALAVGLAVSVVVALVAWRFHVLLARLRATRAATAPTRHRSARRPVIVVDRPVISLLGRHSALRAPPVAASAA
jgi:hypothetical protein